MSATLTTEPVSPASAYRPLWFEVTRTDPTTSRVIFIRPATAGDVAALGNGLVEGDILMQHQAWSGSVPGVVGQTVHLVAAGAYTGLTPAILSAFTVAGSLYVVLDCADLGDYDPSPGFGSARIWLNGYTVWAEVRIYTDPTGAPQVAYMRGTPDVDGVTAFNVAPVVRDYFDADPENPLFPQYVIPWSGTLCKHAHGLTALFYQVKFVELWDPPGDPVAQDPWTDGTVVSDDTEHRVAVNAIHPYHSDLITWETAGMGAFQASTAPGKLLTYAPRLLTLADTDSFRIHMLTNPASGYLTPSYLLRVFTVNADLSLTFLGAQAIDVGSDPVAAFSVAVGPADLAAFFTVPARYRAYVSNDNGNVLSEYVEVIVDTTCKEVRRPVAWLSPLGGVDLYTFTGREIEQAGASRTTVRKPMGTGTGYDWTERGHNTNPSTGYTLSTAPIHHLVRAWIARGLGQSSTTALKLSATQVTPIVLTSGALVSANTGGIYKPLTIEYRRGTDNEAQQA